MGHLGIPRLTEDYPAIDLFNEVFGSGGFGSLLMKRIRTELGLSYGVYGGIAPAVVKGINYIHLQTKSQSTPDAIIESLKVLRATQESPVGDDDLAERKRSIETSFVFNFDSTEDVIGRAARLMLLSYPEDYDKSYLSKISTVGALDIEAVARKRFDLNKFVIVVVGNEAAYTAVQKMMENPPEVLKGYTLKKLAFDESLEIP